MRDKVKVDERSSETSQGETDETPKESQTDN